MQLAKFLNVNVERLNLNSCTEFTDLIGNYIPYKGKFKFIESCFVNALRKGSIIILDEINLCTQSVIEGLNSLLDHRRSLYVNGSVVQSTCLIFGTMNPSSFKGRKRLPKSFIDGFVRVKFNKFNEKEMCDILGEDIAKLNKHYNSSMTECIRAKILGPNIIMRKNVGYKTNKSSMVIGKTRVMNEGPGKNDKLIKDESLSDNFRNLNANNCINELKINNYAFTNKNIKKTEFFDKCIKQKKYL